MMATLTPTIKRMWERIVENLRARRTPDDNGMIDVSVQELSQIIEGVTDGGRPDGWIKLFQGARLIIASPRNRLAVNVEEKVEEFPIGERKPSIRLGVEEGWELINFFRQKAREGLSFRETVEAWNAEVRKNLENE